MSTHNVTCPIVESKPQPKLSPSHSDALSEQIEDHKNIGHELNKIVVGPRLRSTLRELDQVVVSAQTSGTVNIIALGVVLDSVKREMPR